MSSPTIALPPLNTTPSRVKTDADFINKLLEKTEDKKLTWTKDGLAYKTRIPSAELAVELILAQSALFGPAWSKFMVTSRNEEIIRVEGGGNPFALLIGSGTNPVTKAIDELLAYLESARTREVKKAISVLEDL